jgi:deazaflavin-dependent oxidoreductase (nitroreductase family)
MTASPSRRLPDLAVDLGMKAMSSAHRAVLSLSGGRLLGRVVGMQTVELHTVGRRSGRRRSTMLTAPLVSERRVVLVASKGGDDRDPDWYRNLVAEPDVDVTMGARTRAMRARTASPQEKADLWPAIVEAYRGYDGYQRRTRRDIPVVICEPRND